MLHSDLVINTPNTWRQPVKPHVNDIKGLPGRTLADSCRKLPFLPPAAAPGHVATTLKLRLPDNSNCFRIRNSELKKRKQCGNGGTDDLP
jgi:hypothetical protein